ncbi:hypothetical protein JCM17960_33060 [Magnetospira thiophila]
MSDGDFEDKFKGMFDRFGRKVAEGGLDERILQELMIPGGSDYTESWIDGGDSAGGDRGASQGFADEDWVRFVEREEAGEEDSPSDSKNNEPDNVTDAVDAAPKKKGWRARLRGM